MVSDLKIWERKKGGRVSEVGWDGMEGEGVWREGAEGEGERSAYCAKTIIALDHTFLLVLLEIHGFAVFPDAHKDTRAGLFFAVENLGEFFAHGVTLRGLVAVEVDGAVDVLVAFSFEF